MTNQIRNRFKIVPCNQNNISSPNCSFSFCALPLITFNFHIIFRRNVTFSLKTKLIHVKSDYTTNLTPPDMLLILS